jgi:hypothetical protein
MTASLPPAALLLSPEAVAYVEGVGKISNDGGGRDADPSAAR